MLLLLICICNDAGRDLCNTYILLVQRKTFLAFLSIVVAVFLSPAACLLNETECFVLLQENSGGWWGWDFFCYKKGIRRSKMSVTMCAAEVQQIPRLVFVYSAWAVYCGYTAG